MANDLYDDYQESLSLLRQCRQYVQQTHDDAEAKHDSYGEFYMDGGLYEIMQDTEKLLSDIDEVINDTE